MILSKTYFRTEIKNLTYFYQSPGFFCISRVNKTLHLLHTTHTTLQVFNEPMNIILLILLRPKSYKMVKTIKFGQWFTIFSPRAKKLET